ncbi:MAG: acetyl-CoA acetyltransferase [Hyphomicrobiales bacterium]|nr:acetyl-CoA acetyltransferase [Hyphomicrobiales bacterium]MDE2113443.1 acetyl-CoA acetyltransferase [Hyphomicrobiales bacterium]
MSGKAAIVGWAHTPFGKLEDPDVETLMSRVSASALEHAGVSPRDVDAITVGVFNNGFSKQGFEAALVGVQMPELSHVPAMRLENACATGSAALYAALDFIEAGRGRIALVIGAEKMTATPTPEVGDILLAASYRREEAQVDAGFAGIFGKLAQNYFQKYGDHSAELAMIAAKNHVHGLSNPLAHMRKDFGFAFCNTISDKNPYVAGPLRRTDCSLVSDGAAALVVADAETAATLRRAIAFRTRTQVNDLLPLARRANPVAFEGARAAWAKAKAEAGITIDQLDLVETHDCFTIAEMIEYEAMGLAGPGEGWRVAREGQTSRGGRLPVNLSGGLKSRGHPIGATGVSQHVMAAMQLCNDAGDMQLQGAAMAGVFNMGGAAVANYVSILERQR